MNRSFEAISESLSMGLPTWICSTQTAHKTDDQIELEEKEKKEKKEKKRKGKNEIHSRVGCHSGQQYP